LTNIKKLVKIKTDSILVQKLGPS